MKFSKRSKVYAYNPIEHRQNKNKINEANFDEVTFESVIQEIINLEDYNKKLNKDIDVIKDSTIKDMFYTGTKIPSSWTSKANYRNKVINIITKDNSFADYISKMGASNHNLSSHLSTGNLTNKSFHEKVKEKERILTTSGKISNSRLNSPLHDPNKTTSSNFRFRKSHASNLKQMSSPSRKSLQENTLTELLPRLTTAGRIYKYD